MQARGEALLGVLAEAALLVVVGAALVESAVVVYNSQATCMATYIYKHFGV